MADRLTQLQDAVNSVSNFPRIVSVSVFLLGTAREDKGPERETRNWRRAGTGRQQKAVGAAGGVSAVREV